MGRYSIVLHRLGDPGYRAIAAEGLSALEPLGPSPELARALTDEAGRSCVSEEHREALAFADRALLLADKLGLPEPARALGFRGTARISLGDAGGLDDMRRAMELAAAQGLGREVSLLYANLGEAVSPIEGPRAQLEVLREGTAFAERRGVEEFVLTLASLTVEALIALGSYDKATALAAELAPRMEEAEDVFDLLRVRPAQARILARRGKHAEAAPLGKWAVERARKMGDPQVLAQACPPAAAVRLGLGDAPGAVALLAELEGTPNIRDTWYYAPNLPEGVRTALGAGDPELAARLGDGVEPKYPLHEHALIAVRALLAEHGGRQSEAAELFADAAQRWERFEMPWERAQALLGQGRCLLELGRSTESTGPLQAARGIFLSVGAKPALAESDALLERVLRISS